mgnify:CR=1 FL=1
MIKRTNHERKEMSLAQWKERLISIFGEENVYFRDSGPVYTRQLDCNDAGPFFHEAKFSHHIIEACPIRNNPVADRYLLGEYDMAKGVCVLFFDEV